MREVPAVPVAPGLWSLSAAHRKFLFVEQGIGAAIVNFLLNGAIAWVMFRGMDPVPLWGQQSIAGDTLGTAFLLPLITSIILTPLARGRVASATLAALEWTYITHPSLRLLPRGTVRRGATIGAICVVTVGIATVVALWLGGVTSMTFGRFLLFKAAWSAVLAAFVTPIIAVCAIVPALDPR